MILTPSILWKIQRAFGYEYKPKSKYFFGLIDIMKLNYVIYYEYINVLIIKCITHKCVRLVM